MLTYLPFRAAHPDDVPRVSTAQTLFYKTILWPFVDRGKIPNFLLPLVNGLCEDLVIKVDDKVDNIHVVRNHL